MLKAREIETILHVEGFEKGTRIILREMHEVVVSTQVQQAELAQAVTTLAKAIEAVAGGYVGLRKQVERVQRGAEFEKDFDGDK